MYVPSVNIQKSDIYFLPVALKLCHKLDIPLLKLSSCPLVWPPHQHTTLALAATAAPLLTFALKNNAKYIININTRKKTQTPSNCKYLYSKTKTAVIIKFMSFNFCLERE